MRAGFARVKKYIGAPRWGLVSIQDLCGMTVRFAVLLLLGLLLVAAGSVEAENTARAVDSGLLSVLDEIPKCAVSHRRFSA